MKINFLGYSLKITSVVTLLLSLVILPIPSQVLGAVKAQRPRATHSFKQVHQKKARQRPSRALSSGRRPTNSPRTTRKVLPKKRATISKSRVGKRQVKQIRRSAAPKQTRRTPPTRPATQQTRRTPPTRAATQQTRRTPPTRAATQQTRRTPPTRAATQQTRRTPSARVATQQTRRTPLPRAATQQTRRTPPTRAATQPTRRTPPTRAATQPTRRTPPTRAATVRQQVESARLARIEAARQQAERDRLARIEAARQQAEREQLAREAYWQAERERIDRQFRDAESRRRAQAEAARQQAEIERIAREARWQAERERRARDEVARTARQQAERERIARAELEMQQLRDRLAREGAERQQQAERERGAHEEEARRRRGEAQNLMELKQFHLNPTRNMIAPYNDFIMDPINKVLDKLETYFEGDIKLLTPIAKRIKYQVEKWDTVEGLEGISFQKLQKKFYRFEAGLRDALPATFGTYYRHMKSCNRMIERVLSNPGIPAAATNAEGDLVVPLPQNLKINPWMINSPHFDLLTARTGLREDNINSEVSQAEFVVAKTKILNLFDRLVSENKITRNQLYDYEDRMWQNPYADRSKLEDILGRNVRTKNRTITYAKLIWAEDNRQVISDNDTAFVLRRLAIGGRHCDTRAEDDTSWGVARLSNLEVAETNEPFEVKLASLMLSTKKSIISEMVNGERTGDSEPVRRYYETNEDFERRMFEWRFGGPEQLAHYQTRLEQRLTPYVGLSPDAVNFRDGYAFGRDITNRPIETLLTSFRTKCTADRIVMDLTRDIEASLKYKQLEHIMLTPEEEAGKSEAEKDTLKLAKFNAQKKGTITEADLKSFVQRISPDRPTANAGDTLEGIVRWDDDYMNQDQFDTRSAKALLVASGYLEEDDI